MERGEDKERFYEPFARPLGQSLLSFLHNNSLLCSLHGASVKAAEFLLRDKWQISGEMNVQELCKVVYSFRNCSCEKLH